ncbi:MAG: DNA replication complex GINS family protein [Candidatus Aenigmarchaeota archaeon]|nr:DNA replication complex GINS family protein [Candidatus Aenigmarchaeota archaeon]
MLTFEGLRKLFSDEKASSKLVFLPDNFFEEVKEYLDSKSKMAAQEDAWELTEARNILEGLLSTRERKIAALALYAARDNVEIENIHPAEKAFFDEIVQACREYGQKRKELVESKPLMLAFVAFLEPLETFVGIDMLNYGPFSKGDLATIPEENARLLIERGAAKEIGRKE